MPHAGATGAGEQDALPSAVLFTCTMNAVRSVIAEAIFQHLAGPMVRVASCGVHAGQPDPLVDRVLDEIGIYAMSHQPKTFESVSGDSFDLVVTLSPEAHHKALELTYDRPMKVEYWPTMDAAGVGSGSEDERLLRAYRQVRDQLFTRIKSRFQLSGGPTV